MAGIQFPPDVIYEILSRLPIKSLARFRCVCKSWLKHINNPHLQTIHRFKEEPTPIMFPLVPSARPKKNNKPCKISLLRVTQGTMTSGEALTKTPGSLDSKYIHEGGLGSNFRPKTGKFALRIKKFGRKMGKFISLRKKTRGAGPAHGPGNPSPLPMTVKKEHILDVSYNASFEGTLVRGSCNGLTLVYYENNHWDASFLAVINPVTKQRHNLPPVKLTRSSDWACPGLLEAAGIGFDDSTNTLTTVCYIYNISRISNIKQRACTMVHRSGMSSWRELPQNPPYPITAQSVFANGRLHWLARVPAYTYDGIILVWFDVKTEEFGSTDIPKTNSDRVDMWQLVDLDGEVGFAYKYDGIGIKLWVLKPEEWVLKCCFDLDRLRYTDVVVCGCWNNDGDVLLTSNGGKRLFVYTLKSDDFKEVESDGGCEADIRMHRTSFFSIRDIKHKCF